MTDHATLGVVTPTAAYTDVFCQTYALGYALRVAHWNVTGSDFPQLHKFFGKLYADMDDAVDLLAEDLRALKVYAPRSLAAVMKYAESADLPLQTPALLASLSKQNDLTIEAIQAAYKAMDDDPQYFGLCNRLQDRLLAHQKLGWMLRVTAQ